MSLGLTFLCTFFLVVFVACVIAMKARRKKFQFGLRHLLIAMMVFSVVLAHLAYYRSVQRTVAYRVFLIEAPSFDALKLEPHVIKDSPYKWVMLNNEELKNLLNDGEGKLLPFIDKEVLVNGWRRNREYCNRSKAVFLDVDDPTQGENPAKLPRSETGLLKGTLGVRRAGRELQFRIDARTRYKRPDDDIVPRSYIGHPEDSVEGPIFYEGRAPDHGLAFFSNLDETEYHVVIFTIEH